MFPVTTSLVRRDITVTEAVSACPQSSSPAGREGVKEDGSYRDLAQSWRATKPFA